MKVRTPLAETPDGSLEGREKRAVLDFWCKKKGSSAKPMSPIVSILRACFYSGSSAFNLAATRENVLVLMHTDAGQYVHFNRTALFNTDGSVNAEDERSQAVLL